MRPRQLTLDLGDNADRPGPRIYLACRLTNISAEQRELLDSWCTHIEQAIAESTQGSAEPWGVAVYTPFTWSAPWNDQRPDADVHRKNCETVAECAAVIVLCVDGGGLGVGQEFAWAISLRLPILLLHPTKQPISRQASGTPGDVTIAGFENARQLIDEVKTFLRDNRAVIEDWPRRTRSLSLALVPLRESLATRWKRLNDRERDRIQAESRVHQRRIDQLITIDGMLSGASLAEIVALMGALGIDRSDAFTAPVSPDLTPRQRQALGIAADEYEWGGGEVLALEVRARLELARGGTRRLSLNTPADWVRFRDRAAG